MSEPCGALGSGGDEGRESMDTSAASTDEGNDLGPPPSSVPDVHVCY